MSETTTTGATAIRLRPADDEQPLEASVSEPAEDDFSPEDPYSVFDIEVEDEDPFESIDEILALEEAEKKGRWVKWEAVPDGRVKIAHLSAALQRRGELERKLREKKGWTYKRYPDGQLPGMSEEWLWWEAMFGTAVLGWEGESFAGRAFTEKQYLKLMHNSRRFRKFVFERTGTVDDLRKKMQEESEGN